MRRRWAILSLRGRRIRLTINRILRNMKKRSVLLSDKFSVALGSACVRNRRRSIKLQGGLLVSPARGENALHPRVTRPVWFIAAHRNRWTPPTSGCRATRVRNRPVSRQGVSSLIYGIEGRRGRRDAERSRSTVKTMRSERFSMFRARAWQVKYIQLARYILLLSIKSIILHQVRKLLS